MPTLGGFDDSWDASPFLSQFLSTTHTQQETKKVGQINLERVGSDVEVFLIDGNKKPVPCIGLVGGTKEKPRPLALGDGFAIQEDNVMLEYNVPAAKDVYSFVYSLMRVREAIVDEVKQHGLTPVAAASMRFDPEQLKHRQARTAGCDPDFCVWERKINEKVELDKELRCAGGHVHISFNIDGQIPVMPDFLAPIESVVKALDIYLGVPATLLDKDRERRKMYGKAGAFRPRMYGEKSAGLEYRVLSTFWTDNPRSIGWVYDQVEAAIRFINAHGTQGFENFVGKYKEKILKAINDGDEGSAHRIINDWHMRLPV